MTRENIFETAAKKLGRAKKSPAPEKKKNLTPPRYEDPEITEMLGKIKFMKEDLNKQIDNIKRKTGPGSAFKKMLENKYNLTPKEWEKIQLAKKLLGDRVWESIGIQTGTANAPPPPTPSHTNRKGKTLGSRKKWIPMR